MGLKLKEVIHSPDSLLGRTLTHTWDEDGMLVQYCGKVLKCKSPKCVSNKTFVVSYWLPGENCNPADKFDISLYSMIADISTGDLVLHRSVP